VRVLVDRAAAGVDQHADGSDRLQGLRAARKRVMQATCARGSAMGHAVYRSSRGVRNAADVALFGDHGHSLIVRVTTGGHCEPDTARSSLRAMRRSGHRQGRRERILPVVWALCVCGLLAGIGSELRLMCGLAHATISAHSYPDPQAMGSTRARSDPGGRCIRCHRA